MRKDQREKDRAYSSRCGGHVEQAGAKRPREGMEVRVQCEWQVRSLQADYVFYNGAGHRMDARDLLRVFYPATKKADVKRFHDLRHTFATRLVQAVSTRFSTILAQSYESSSHRRLALRTKTDLALPGGTRIHTCGLIISSVKLLNILFAVVIIATAWYVITSTAISFLQR